MPIRSSATHRLFLGLLLSVAAGIAHSEAPMVAGRGGHALVLKSDGTVVAWGSNGDGQLGNGRRLLDPTPVRLPNLPAMVQTASSDEHVVALDSNGRVWTWGTSTHARLGVRVQRNPAIPGRVQGIQDVIGIAASDFGSFAIKSDGTVWMWGGSLGCWAATSPNPRPLAGLTDIVQISAGGDHLVMRTRAGTVVTFGSNQFGQSGDGTIDPPNCSRQRFVVSVPGLSNIAFVNAGRISAHAVTADGTLYSWGQLWGAAPNGPVVASPTIVAGFPKPVRKVVARDVLYATLDDGAVWMWWTSFSGNAGGSMSQIPGLASIEELAAPSYSANSVLARDTSGRLFVYSANNFGEMGGGVVSNIVPIAAQVPLASAVRTMSVGYFGVVAITADGATWTWGRDGLGLLGRGELTSSAAPVPVSGLGNIRKLALGLTTSFALDAAGNVWGWGSNDNSQLGTLGRTPRSIPARIDGFDGVIDIAASWGALLMLGADGKVRALGPVSNLPGSTSPLESLPPVVRMGAGWAQHFFVTASGDLWAFGDNSFGQLGDGTTTNRATPVKISGLPPVAQVVSEFSFAMALTTGGEVWAWGSYGSAVLGDSALDSLVPQRVPGLSGIVEIAVGLHHALARRDDGTVLSWGAPFSGFPYLGRAGDPKTPMPVDGLDQVISIAGAENASYAISADGSVWGWGGAECLSSSCPLPGDGTLVSRDRPGVVIRESGAGNLDTNDWFLDAKPGTPKLIPASKVPKLISLAQSLSSSGVLNVDASVNVKLSDQAKTLGLYVVGLVPPAFLDQVTTAPGALASRSRLKVDQMVLVNLTPSGWTVASGQLESLRSGVGNALSAATSLLVNVNPATIPGARFCVGYGESASDMIRTGTIRDFLSLEGAASNAFGLPCLLSGAYVDGPHSSPKGTAVPIRAVVVGQAPTGAVRFRERFRDISSDIAIAPVNAAVSEAIVSYTPPAAGEYAFVANYAGDGLNAAASSEVPLRHVVRDVQASTTVRIDAPVASEIGMELRLVASLTGNRPEGNVQFKRGSVDEGAAVPVIDDQAVVSVVGLGIGEYSFTATYSGDASNTASTSPAFVHKVLDVATSAATLSSSANPARLGDAVTFQATVTGTSPTGTVTLRERATVIASKTLVGSGASFTLNGLGAGVHVFSLDYAGDGKNPAATSNAVFQQVTLALSPTGDLDGDGIPNVVETAEGLNPDLRDNDVFANTRLFAMQQYRDFLSREGDGSGVAFWASQMNSAAQTRAQMIESFFGSVEFQGAIAPVARLYFAYFLRIPDYEGLNYWIGQARAGSSLETLSNAFASSSEFVNRYGSLSNEQFVALVYQNVLGRTPDAAGLAYWAGRLTSDLSRGQLMVQFSESAEYAAVIGSEVYVTMMYYGMLRRMPDQSGFAFWVDYVDKGNSGVALINGFLAATEYRERFLP